MEGQWKATEFHLLVEGRGGGEIGRDVDLDEPRAQLHVEHHVEGQWKANGRPMESRGRPWKAMDAHLRVEHHVETEELEAGAAPPEERVVPAMRSNQKR